MRRSFIAALALFLGGCARFDPKPLSSEETAAQFQGRTLTDSDLAQFVIQNQPRATNGWPLAHWDLNTLTLAAFYYHPSLEVARADWQVALGGQKTASEMPNPSVTASAAFEPAPDAFSPWIPGLIFDLPVETAGKRRLRKEQARHLSDAARLNIATTAWQVRSRVRLAAIELAAAQQRRDLLQQQVALHDEMARRLQSQYESGFISALEWNVARLAVLRAQADLGEAQRAAAEARPRLANALGVPSAALERIVLAIDLSAAPGGEELTGVQARNLALRGRADILSALAEYAASQSVLQLEIAKQYPDVHLAPGYSWNAGSSGEHDWQIGATIELPLLNQHQGAIAEAAARREASAARFRALQARVIGDVEAAVTSFRSSQTNLTTFTALVRSARDQRVRVQSQFQAGAADRLDVLTAEVDLNAALLNQNDAQIRLQQSLNLLEDSIQRPLDMPLSILNPRQTAHAK